MDERLNATGYRLTPECPCCNGELNDEAEIHDRFTGTNKQPHHIIECQTCEARLELIIYHTDPIEIEIWVMPVFTPLQKPYSGFRPPHSG